MSYDFEPYVPQEGEDEIYGNGNDKYEEEVIRRMEENAEQSDTTSDEIAEVNQGVIDLDMEEEADDEEKANDEEKIESEIKKKIIIELLTDKLEKTKNIDEIINKYEELKILLSSIKREELKETLIKKINVNKNKKKQIGYTINEIINSKTWKDHEQLFLTNIPTIKGKINYIRYLFTIPQKNHQEREKILKNINIHPIEYYKESLKEADKYVQDHKITSLTTAIGAAFEAHRKRLWEYFGFIVFGNKGGSQERFLGGYAIDQYIFWKNELIVLEEDKAHIVDSSQLEHVIMGMAKTIYNYHTKNLDFGDNLTLKKIPKILINSLCVSWEDVNTFRIKTQECFNVLDEKIVNDFDVDHTYLSQIVRIPNWYKSTGGGINCFYEYAEEEKIIEDIKYIIELIPKNETIQDWPNEMGKEPKMVEENYRKYFYNKLSKAY
tara:strand:- start:34 stop:1344 length:1311 start_codon:yes stop_codon:yes gene_type:complete